MRLLKQAAFVAALMFLAVPILAPVAALAQDAATSTVTAEWGDWAANALLLVSTIVVGSVGAVLTWALRFLPAALRGIITQNLIKQVEQLLVRALQHSINMVAEQLRGRELTIDVKNQVVAAALQYALDNAPAKLIEWMGGEAGIRQKIEARLPWQVVSEAPLPVPAGTVMPNGDTLVGRL